MRIKKLQDCRALLKSINYMSLAIEQKLEGLTFQELDAMPDEVFETLKEAENKMDVLHYNLTEK